METRSTRDICKTLLRDAPRPSDFFCSRLRPQARARYGPERILGVHRTAARPGCTPGLAPIQIGDAKWEVGRFTAQALDFLEVTDQSGRRRQPLRLTFALHRVQF